MSQQAAVALGSNLGDRLAVLRGAVQALGAIGSVDKISSIYETVPVGGSEQGPYLNAVVLVNTDLSPEALLAATQEIEDRAGRVRAELWGPRTLDLDIVTMVDATGAPTVTDSDLLQVPHPRASQRRFVLEPLAEVWPEAPVGTGPARAALLEVGDQEVERLGGNWTNPTQWMSPALLAAQMVALGVFAVVAVTTGLLPELSWRAAVGVITALAGAVVVGWASVSLGSALTAFPEPRAGTELVDSGPYRWVRHPIYVGVELALLGVSIFVGSWTALAVAVAIGVLLWFKAGYEESRLRLGVAGYAAYMRRVRGRLVPRG